MTPELYYRRYVACFPSKRAHIDNRDLQIGQEVSYLLQKEKSGDYDYLAPSPKRSPWHRRSR